MKSKNKHTRVSSYFLSTTNRNLIELGQVTISNYVISSAIQNYRTTVQVHRKHCWSFPAAFELIQALLPYALNTSEQRNSSSNAPNRGDPPESSSYTPSSPKDNLVI